MSKLGLLARFVNPFKLSNLNASAMVLSGRSLTFSVKTSQILPGYTNKNVFAVERHRSFGTTSSCLRKKPANDSNVSFSFAFYELLVSCGIYAQVC
jgi:hypothetical protein